MEQWRVPRISCATIKVDAQLQMSMNVDEFNAVDYEARYQQGQGLTYPEGHIIRVHRQILEWELNLTSGRLFDFGCGAGAHLKYFADHGFVPYGCDTSKTAINLCKERMPEYADHLFVSTVRPDFEGMLGNLRIDVFLANQVLYFLDDAGIRDVVQQAYQFVKPNGVFVASMMAYSCFYSQYVIGAIGDFKKVKIATKRQLGELLINFKHRDELPGLFEPFKPLHIGSYGSHIRQEEGSTDHWLFVGLRPT